MVSRPRVVALHFHLVLHFVNGSNVHMEGLMFVAIILRLFSTLDSTET